MGSTLLSVRGGRPSTRNSNLELYRVIVMLLIVAHHYVVNSGLMDVMIINPLSGDSLFLYLFGMWGKTGINCFVMITGYFMCRSSITLKKFLKLLLEVEFYKIVIYLIFLSSGYEPFSLKLLFKDIVPVYDISNGFTSCFLIFYLCIPFLNALIQNISRKQHIQLIALCLFVYTLFGTIPGLHVTMNYVSWFCVLYFIASYIRNYGLFNVSNKIWGIFTLTSVILSSFSVIVLLWITAYCKLAVNPYRFISDSNAIFAVLTAICSFMYFKDMNIRQNKLINLMGASTFGVLLIHANSDTMRQWLWSDTLDNVGHFMYGNVILHSILSVLAVFIICSIIDCLRRYFVERKLFEYIDKYFKTV